MSVHTLSLVQARWHVVTTGVVTNGVQIIPKPGQHDPARRPQKSRRL
jgi:hypothetical protein